MTSQATPYAPATPLQRPKGVLNLQRPYAPALYIEAGGGGVVLFNQYPSQRP